MNSTKSAERPTGPAIEAEGRARESSSCSVDPLTLDVLASDGDFGARYSYRCSNFEPCRARPIFGRPRTAWARAPTNISSVDLSIERIVLMMQSNGRLVGFILRALGFEDALDANQSFCFPLSPSRESKPAGRGWAATAQGFELGGHVGDVAGNVEPFPRHSPARRIVGSSRRSRGSVPSGSSHLRVSVS